MAIEVKFGEEAKKLNNAINIKIGKPLPKVKLKLKKTMNGDLMILDHPDIDIIVSPDKKKIVTFAKDGLGDKIYAAQDKMFKFLSKNGIINLGSVRAGNVFNAMEATYPAAAAGNEDMIVIYAIGKWLEEEKPYLEILQKYEEDIENNYTDPSEEDSTNLGEVPQEEDKGSLKGSWGKNINRGWSNGGGWL